MYTTNGKQDFISLEGQMLFGDYAETYFVDYVSVQADGEHAFSSRFSSKDRSKARQFAASLATQNGLQVNDKTALA